MKNFFITSTLALQLLIPSITSAASSYLVLQDEVTLVNPSWSDEKTVKKSVKILLTKKLNRFSCTIQDRRFEVYPWHVDNSLAVVLDHENKYGDTYPSEGTGWFIGSLGGFNMDSEGEYFGAIYKFGIYGEAKIEQDLNSIPEVKRDQVSVNGFRCY